MLLGSRSALAQEAPPAAEQPAQAASAPDLIVLKNGDRLRGTIAELSHDGEPIVIVLITGKTRKVDSSYVRYAGPADREPPDPQAQAAPVPAPAPTPRANAAPEPSANPSGLAKTTYQRLRLTSNERTEFFYRPDGEAVGFESLCTAPCASTVPNGTYAFGVKLAGGEHVLPLRSVLVDTPTELTATVSRRTGTRGAGVLLICLSLLAAGATTYYLKSNDYPGTDVLAAYGYGTSLVALSVGVTLSLVDDKASLSVTQAP